MRVSETGPGPAATALCSGMCTTTGRGETLPKCSLTSKLTLMINYIEILLNNLYSHMNNYAEKQMANY